MDAYAIRRIRSRPSCGRPHMADLVRVLLTVAGALLGAWLLTLLGAVLLWAGLKVWDWLRGKPRS